MSGTSAPARRGGVHAAARLVASAGGIGFLPRGPATAASLVAAAIYWLARPGWPVQLECVIAALALGQACAAVLATPYDSDPGYLVMDEIAGVWVALFALPLNLAACASGAVVFRVLDRLKPPPVGTVDRYGGRLAVMGDDVVAGVLAGILLHIAVAIL